jgi:hypothetical protein
MMELKHRCISSIIFQTTPFAFPTKKLYDLYLSLMVVCTLPILDHLWVFPFPSLAYTPASSPLSFVFLGIVAADEATFPAF